MSTLSTAALRPRKLGFIGECSTTAYTIQTAIANTTFAAGVWPPSSTKRMIPVTVPIVSSENPSVTDASVRCSSRSRLANPAPGATLLERRRWLTIRYIAPTAPATAKPMAPP